MVLEAVQDVPLVLVLGAIPRFQLPPRSLLAMG